MKSDRCRGLGVALGWVVRDLRKDNVLRKDLTTKLKQGSTK